MNNLHVFEMQTGIFAVFWLLFSLYGLWKTRRTYEEKVAEAERAIDNLISATKLLPHPKILPGLFVGVWIFCTMVDVIGVALIFSVMNKVDWVVKILIVILLLAAINGLHELTGNLQAMDDEQHLRERLMSNINRYVMRIMTVESWTRFLLSVILLAAAYL